jgi:hypothetical protein
LLDDDTVIRQPHDATVERMGGGKVVTLRDPRTSVTIQESGAALSLFFDAVTGDLDEVRMARPETGDFEPWRLLASLPLHVQYARSALAGRGVDAAVSALRQANAPRRGITDDFLRVVAQLHGSLVSDGEPYPVKAIAGMQHVDISTASRWIAAARARGFLPAKGTER